MSYLIEYRKHCISIVGLLSVCIFTNAGCVLYYGEDCRYPCSEHCFNQTCNRFNGRCVFRCHDGFSGDQCSQGIFKNRFVNQNITSNLFAFNLTNDSYLPLANMKIQIPNWILNIYLLSLECTLSQNNYVHPRLFCVPIYNNIYAGWSLVLVWKDNDTRMM